MGGVVAGTAVLNANETGKLHTVTLTINNQCNLKCPHCYLQYSGAKGLIAPEIIEYLFTRDTSLRHVAIVGMEPLVTKDSAEICRTVITRAKAQGMTSSLITNGLNLSWLGEDVLAQLDFLDISLDGGRETYHRYRGGNLSKIEKGISWANHLGYNRLNALEVLNKQTLAHVDDMMDFAGTQWFRQIMFSPYVPTDVEGYCDVSMVTLREALETLKKSSLFMTDERAFLLIDVYHCWFEGITIEEAQSMARRTGMGHKVHFIPQDPTALGIIRLTYDGLVLSSFDALHTSWYKARGRAAFALPTLDDHYASIQENVLSISEKRKAA
jgi:sulfatase maturation enzyme AslB (radical SAM superfamily)